MLEWKEQYATGFSDLDSQHRILFKQINRLGTAIESKRFEKKHAEEMIRYLESYCLFHFNREESCMSQHHCSAEEINKDAHQEFIVSFDALKNSFVADTSAESLLKEIHRLCVDWVTDHIYSVDTSLRGCSMIKRSLHQSS